MNYFNWKKPNAAHPDLYWLQTKQSQEFLTKSVNWNQYWERQKTWDPVLSLIFRTSAYSAYSFIFKGLTPCQRSHCSNMIVQFGWNFCIACSVFWSTKFFIDKKISEILFKTKCEILKCWWIIQHVHTCLFELRIGFLKKNFPVTSHYFVEPLVLSVLEFGGLCLWVLKPGYIHHYLHSFLAYI